MASPQRRPGPQPLSLRDNGKSVCVQEGVGHQKAVRRKVIPRRAIQLVVDAALGDFDPAITLTSG